MTTFTASEVRRTATAIEGKQMLVSSMLRAFADLLEADDKAVPVAWMHPELHKGHPYPEECLSTEAIDGWLPLYTRTQPVQDAKDVARYRWLRDFADSYTWDYLGGIGADRVEAAIDAAMAKESGR